MKKFTLLAAATMFICTVSAQDPTTPPTPNWDASDVFNIIGSTYEYGAGSSFKVLTWGQKCTSDYDEAGDDEAYRIDNLDFLPIQFNKAISLDNYKYLHMDVWPSEDTHFYYSFIRWMPDGSQLRLYIPTQQLKANQWNSLDLDLSIMGWNVKNNVQERLVNILFFGGQEGDTEAFASKIWIANLVAHNGDTSGTVVTGIKTINNTTSKKIDNSSYNLLGQKIGNNYKGIVIKNGKKVLVK